tara:strand:+ start:223 stop:825 length:603 start_codon:yes stop_codon:yes gene_type:complete
MSLRNLAKKVGPKEEIIAATEALLIEGGPPRATVRAITSAAGVNIGAVNYYFGSREELLTVICCRHMEYFNQEILLELENLDLESGKVSVEDIFRPLVKTAFEQWMYDEVLRGFRSFLFLDNTLMQKLDLSSMGLIYEKMRLALAVVRPDLSSAVIKKHFSFAMGSIMYVLHRFDADSDSDGAPGDVDDLLLFLAKAFSS